MAFVLCIPIATHAGPVEKGSVDTNSTSLYYESRGSGTPVILIEGGNLDLRMWDPQFATFSKHHLVIRYDVRGFGRSGPYGASYRALDDLAGLMDALHIDRAHLVGLSLGGRIAIDFALEHPDRVRSLALSGPGLSGFAWSPTGNEWYEPIAEAAARGDSIGAADAWLESPYMSPAMQDAHLAKRLRVLAHANSRAWVHPETEAQLEPPAVGRLGEIHAPVLLLLGTRDVPDIHAIVEALTVGIPQSRRVELAGVGHMLNLERTADFNRAVLDFIDSVDHR